MRHGNRRRKTAGEIDWIAARLGKAVADLVSEDPLSQAQAAVVVVSEASKVEVGDMDTPPDMVTYEGSTAYSMDDDSTVALLALATMVYGCAKLVNDLTAAVSRSETPTGDSVIHAMEQGRDKMQTLHKQIIEMLTAEGGPRPRKDNKWMN